MPDSRNQQEVKTAYPVVEGLTAGTTKQVGKKFLLSEIEEKSLVSYKDKVGI